MTTTTDLTPRSLDELESSAVLALSNPSLGYWVHPDHVLALIAMARDKQAAERERDALRAVLTGVIAWAEDGPDGCFSCVPDDAPEGKRHQGWCWVHSAVTALTQPTDAGGHE